MNPPSQNFTLKDTTAVVCDNCKNETFTESMFMRRASRLLTGSPKDTYIPIPVFVCSACGHANDEFIPKELQKNAVDILQK